MTAAENCERHQENLAAWARLARIYRDHKQFARAVVEQEYAAKEYVAMWQRLAQLIGSQPR